MGFHSCHRLWLKTCDPSVGSTETLARAVKDRKWPILLKNSVVVESYLLVPGARSAI
jgi:hypothetical protein